MAFMQPLEVEARYKQLEDSIRAWGQGNPSVRAAVLVGSRARQDHPADAYSDLDVILFTSDVAGLAARRDWLEAFGEVWAAWMEESGAGDSEWLVVYAGGIKADFMLAPVDSGENASLGELLARLPYQDVLARGVRVLFDKGSSSEGLPAFSPANEPPAHPSPQQLRALVEQCLVMAARAAKLIRRGDLWRAKRASDGELKQVLLTLMEWHARARNGLGHDTWYEGRFLPEWADPRALQKLPDTFAAYDQADLGRALLADLDLFCWLAQETAEALGYPYDAQRDTQMLGYIRALLSD